MPNLTQVLTGALLAAAANGGVDTALLKSSAPGTALAAFGNTGDDWLTQGGKASLIGRYNQRKITAAGAAYQVPAWHPDSLELPTTSFHSGLDTQLIEANEETLILVIQRPPQGTETGAGNCMIAGTETLTAADGGSIVYANANGINMGSRGIAATRTLATSAIAPGSSIMIALSKSVSGVSGFNRIAFLGGGANFTDTGTPPTVSVIGRTWSLGELYYASGWARQLFIKRVLYVPFAMTLAQLNALYPALKADMLTRGITVT